MSAAAAAASSRCMRNHRSTRRRTRSVSAARSAWVIGRAGRNAGGPSLPASAAGGTKTPSVTQAWRCTWWLSAEPKRCRKEMPPSRGRADAGMLVAGLKPDAASRVQGNEMRMLVDEFLSLSGGRAGGNYLSVCNPVAVTRETPMVCLFRPPVAFGSGLWRNSGSAVAAK